MAGLFDDIVPPSDGQPVAAPQQSGAVPRGTQPGNSNLPFFADLMGEAPAAPAAPATRPPPDWTGNTVLQDYAPPPDPLSGPTPAPPATPPRILDDYGGTAEGGSEIGRQPRADRMPSASGRALDVLQGLVTGGDSAPDPRGVPTRVPGRTVENVDDYGNPMQTPMIEGIITGPTFDQQGRVLARPVEVYREPPLSRAELDRRERERQGAVERSRENRGRALVEGQMVDIDPQAIARAGGWRGPEDITQGPVAEARPAQRPGEAPYPATPSEFATQLANLLIRGATIDFGVEALRPWEVRQDETNLYRRVMAEAGQHVQNLNENDALAVIAYGRANLPPARARMFEQAVRGVRNGTVPPADFNNFLDELSNTSNWIRSARETATQFIEAGTPVSPDLERQFIGQVARGAGTTVGGLLVSMLPAGAWVNGLAFWSQQESQAVSDAIRHGANNRDIMRLLFERGGTVGAAGLTEFAELELILNPVRRNPGAVGFVTAAALNMVRNGAAEGLQEAFTQVVQNLEAGRVYDPTQNVWADVTENAAMGAAVGAMFGAFGAPFMERREPSQPGRAPPAAGSAPPPPPPGGAGGVVPPPGGPRQPAGAGVQTPEDLPEGAVPGETLFPADPAEAAPGQTTITFNPLPGNEIDNLGSGTVAPPAAAPEIDQGAVPVAPGEPVPSGAPGAPPVAPIAPIAPIGASPEVPPGTDLDAPAPDARSLRGPQLVALQRQFGPDFISVLFDSPNAGTPGFTMRAALQEAHAQQQARAAAQTGAQEPATIGADVGAPQPPAPTTEQPAAPVEPVLATPTGLSPVGPQVAPIEPPPRPAPKAEYPDPGTPAQARAAGQALRDQLRGILETREIRPSVDAVSEALQVHPRTADAALEAVYWDLRNRSPIVRLTGGKGWRYAALLPTADRVGKMAEKNRAKMVAAARELGVVYDETTSDTDLAAALDAAIAKKQADAAADLAADLEADRLEREAIQAEAMLSQEAPDADEVPFDLETPVRPEESGASGEDGPLGATPTGAAEPVAQTASDAGVDRAPVGPPEGVQPGSPASDAAAPGDRQRPDRKTGADQPVAQPVAESQNAPTIDAAPEEAPSDVTGESVRTDLRPGAEGSPAAGAPRPKRERKAKRSPDADGGGHGPGASGDAGANAVAGTTAGELADANAAAELGSGSRDGSGSSGLPSGESGGFRGTNYRISDADELGKGGARAKARQNLDAIRIVKTLAAEGRPATPEEQAKLVKYTGWGDTQLRNNIFEDPNTKAFRPGWEAMGEELRALLTDEEYATAQRSSLHAHYTSQGIISGMWQAMQRLGFTGGRVFEPGMGIGHFNGLMPLAIAGRSTYTGIEFDHMTAAIARALYPQSNMRTEDFTKSVVPKNFFDVAIGNPPFNNTVILADRAYAKQRFFLHDFFFAKTIDGVKPGGILAFVTSAGTMNKSDDKARAYLAERADLIGAVRLPQTAFKENAGTEVVTDVIFLRKRADGEAPAPWAQEWAGTTEVQTPDGPATINQYFAAHPEMVLGENRLSGTMYRDKMYTVEAREGADLPAEFVKAVQSFPENVYGAAVPEGPAATPTANQPDYNPKATKDGAYYIADDGSLKVRQSGIGQDAPVSKDNRPRIGMITPREAAIVRDYVPLRDAARAVLAAQLTNGDLAAAQATLSTAYDAFVKKHGFINKQVLRERQRTVSVTDEQTGEERSEQQAVTVASQPNIDAFEDDPDAFLVASLENFDEETNTATKAPIFTQRTINAETTPEIATPQDALNVVLNQHGRVNMAAIGTLLNVTPEEAAQQLGDAVWLDPESGQYQTEDEYFSGNVRRKLKIARAAAESDPAFKRHAEELEKRQPADVGPSEISANLGQSWIPTDDIEAFGSQAMGIPLRVRHTATIGHWSVSSPEADSAASRQDWGTPDRSAVGLLESALNKSPVVVMDTIYENGQSKQVRNDTKTAAAQDKLQRIKEAFSNWIWTDADRATRLSAFYNENYNNIAPRVFNGDHLTLPGTAAGMALRPHQKRVVWRIIQTGNTYMAHAVGAGKTMAMTAAGMEMKRLGLVKKPMYVVPNHMLGQFSRELLQLYPTAQIMVADEKNFHLNVRKQFLGRIATNNPDAVIITQSAFGRVNASSAFEGALITEQIEEITQAMDGEKDRTTRRRLESMKERLEQRAAELAARPKDTLVTFEELGTDFMFVDEAQDFRKLQFTSNQNNIKGIDPNGSIRAWDLYVKSRYLDRQRPGRSMVLASGTPITNTLGEAFTIQRYLTPGLLRERNLHVFDAWSSQFGDMVQVLEADAAGVYKPVSRFAKFQNLPELQQMVREVMDTVTSEELNVPRPAINTGARQIITTERSEALGRYQKALAERMEELKKRKGPPQKGEDNILVVMNDGRKAAIDMRLVYPGASNDPNSKLNTMIARAFDIWKKTKKKRFADRNGTPHPIPGATQMIFSDVGTPDGGEPGDFRAYNWIKRELVRRGVPDGEIAFIQDHKKAEQKIRLFDDMNTGRKRILIGSSAGMSTGVNAQRRLIALHHLNADYLPAVIEQREGRIYRQGNQNETIDILAYATKQTYDQTLWTILATKQRFIDQFLRGSTGMRQAEDLDASSDQFATAAAIASGDPRLMEFAGLQGDVARLSRLEGAHRDAQVSAASTVRESERNAEWAGRHVDRLTEALSRRTDTRGDLFTMKVGTRDYSKRADAANAIAKKLTDIRESVSPTNYEGSFDKIGTIGGMDVLARQSIVSAKSGAINVTISVGVSLDGKTLYHSKDWQPAADPAGLVQSMEASLRSMERDLAEATAERNTSMERAKQFRARIGAPFPQAEELKDKRQRMQQLEAELKADPKTEEALPAVSVGSFQPTRGLGFDFTSERRRSRERDIAQRPRPIDQTPAPEPGAVYSASLSDDTHGLYVASPEAAVLRQQAREEIGALLTRLIGPHFAATLHVADRLHTMSGTEINGSAMPRFADATSTDVLDWAIALSRQSADITHTARHESIHIAKRLGVFSVQEWAALEQAARRHGWVQAFNIATRYPGESESIHIEEAIADQFATWARETQPPPATNLLGSAFRAFQRFLRAVRAWWHDFLGRNPDAAEIFQRFEDGTLRQQSGNPQFKGGAQVDHSLDAEATGIFTVSKSSWDGRWVVRNEHGLLEDEFETEAQAKAAAREWSRQDINGTREYPLLQTPNLPAVQPKGMTIGIGGKRYPVGSFAEASDMVSAARDRAGVGGTEFYSGAQPIIYDSAGKPIAHVAYNGKVFPGESGRDWKPGTPALYNPYAAAPAQTAIPGTEPISDKQLAERRMDERGLQKQKGKKTKDAEDLPLFDTGARRQGSLFQTPPAQGPATGGTTPAQAAASMAVRAAMAKPTAIDRAIRLPFQVFGGVNDRGEWVTGLKMTAAAERIIKTATLPDSLPGSAALNNLIERARVGLIDRYGLSEDYNARDRERMLEASTLQRQGAEHAAWLSAQNITPLEARTLQKFLTGELVDNAEWERMLARFGDRAEAVRASVDALGLQAVELGLISRESYERNRGAYLHRVYLNHETAAAGSPEGRSANRSKGARVRLMADEMKGRGLFFNVKTARLLEGNEGWWGQRSPAELKGQKFFILDKTRETNAPDLDAAIDPTGSIEKRAYWPSSEPIPEHMAGWTNRGEFEVRQVAGDRSVIWRDFAPEERERMGEILDARYTIAKTFHLLGADIATGRFFRDIANNDEWSRERVDGDSWIEASQYSSITGSTKGAEWVKVPSEEIPGTGGKMRWGALAGRFVRAEIWRDLHATNMQRSRNEFTAWWSAILNQWKLNKALALDTPLPTPTGWTTMGEIREGDALFDEHGHICRVTGVREIAHGRPCFRVVFSDGSSIVADDEHWWVTLDRSGDRRGKLRRVTTRDIRATMREPTRGDANHSIAVAGALDTPNAALPILPYVLGLWLGDGDKRSGRITAGRALAEETRAAIAAAGAACSPGSVDRRNGVQTFSVEGLTKALRHAGYVGEKRIPPAYLRASIKQRRALLCGLMDSDGWVTARGDCGFGGSNEPLIRDVTEVLRSLGYKPTVCEVRGSKKPTWRVNFRAYADEPVFRLRAKLERLCRRPLRPQRSSSRQIVAVEPVPSVPVRCIEVDAPSHLYLAGEAMVPTHNTARSPTVHMNNVVSNLWLMDMHDIKFGTLVRAIKALKNGDAVYQAAVEAGVFESGWATAEIKREVLGPLLDEIQKQTLPSDAVVGPRGWSAKVAFMGRFLNKLHAVAKTVDRTMLAAYRVEDEVFKLAAYMTRMRMGDAPHDAANFAREAFIDYDIRAPWVQAARHSVLPFISYTYRAVPMMAKTILTRPWKVAKYAGLMYALNALAYAMWPGDEDAERESLRREQRSWLFPIMAPRMLRLWNDEYDRPMFLDLRNWMPGGNFLDMAQGQSVIPLPAWLNPGGPLLIAAELMLNRQAFTGQDIVSQRTATPLEHAGQALDYAWKTWMPNAAFIPGTWSFDTVRRSFSGERDRLGRPYSVPESLAVATGIKLSPQDVALGFDNQRRQIRGELRELNQQLRTLTLDWQRGRVSMASRESRAAELQGRIADRNRELQRIADLVRRVPSSQRVPFDPDRGD